MSEREQVVEVELARLALRRHGGPMQDQNDCSCGHCVALRGLLALVREQAVLLERTGQLERDLAELDHSFDLYYGAMKRGDQVWRATSPVAARSPYLFPDTGDLIAWLLKLVERAEACLAPAPPIDTPEHAIWEAGYLWGWRDAENEYGPFVPGAQAPRPPKGRRSKKVGK